MYEQASKLRQMIAQKHHLKAPMNNIKVICVTSGKGGVGKTNISVNMAIAIQSLGKRVLLVDADLGLANVDVLAGLYPKYNISHFINFGKAVKDILVEGPMGIMILPGASGLSNIADMSLTEINRLVESFDKLDMPFDIVIIDTGAGISRNVTSFISSSDEVIVVVTPEPSAVTDAYAIIKTIHKDPQKIHVIVNRAENYKDADYTMEKLERASRKFLDTKVNYLGYVLEDRIVYRANMSQTPFYIKYPKANASKCIDNIGKTLLYGSQVSVKNENTLETWFRKLAFFIRKDQGAK